MSPSLAAPPSTSLHQACASLDTAASLGYVAAQLGISEEGVKILDGDSGAVLLGGLVVQPDCMPGSPQSG